MSAPVTRRRFVAGVGTALFAVAGWGVVALRSDTQLVGLSQRLRELFDGPSLLKPLGERALGAGRSWPTLEAVTAELAGTIGWDDEPVVTASEPPPEQLAGSLAAAVVADFEAGDTVVVDGWLLSRTEVRLLALARLDPSF